jgi:hypothetical protein
MATAEFERMLARAREELAGPEGEAIREQIAWFSRRYPSPLDRIAYCRRKYKEAMAMQRNALGCAEAKRQAR